MNRNYTQALFSGNQILNKPPKNKKKRKKLKSFRLSEEMVVLGKRAAKLEGMPSYTAWVEGLHEKAFRRLKILSKDGTITI